MIKKAIFLFSKTKFSAIKNYIIAIVLIYIHAKQNFTESYRCNIRLFTHLTRKSHYFKTKHTILSLYTNHLSHFIDVLID